MYVYLRYQEDTRRVYVQKYKYKERRHNEPQRRTQQSWKENHNDQAQERGNRDKYGTKNRGQPTYWRGQQQSEQVHHWRRQWKWQGQHQQQQHQYRMQHQKYPQMRQHTREEQILQQDWRTQNHGYKQQKIQQQDWSKQAIQRGWEPQKTKDWNGTEYRNTTQNATWDKEWPKLKNTNYEVCPRCKYIDTQFFYRK